jgi:hypothetical protein
VTNRIFFDLFCSDLRLSRHFSLKAFAKQARPNNFANRSRTGRPGWVKAPAPTNSNAIHQQVAHSVHACDDCIRQYKTSILRGPGSAPQSCQACYIAGVLCDAGILIIFLLALTPFVVKRRRSYSGLMRKSEVPLPNDGQGATRST